MMNLDLLFSASKLTGDNKYREVAIAHAMTTMKHHFRPDYSSYHVVSYHNDGTVESQGTHQGKNDASSCRADKDGPYMDTPLVTVKPKIRFSCNRLSTSPI